LQQTQLHSSYRHFEHEQPKMSWRNQGITGSNNIPLGKARRFGSEAGDDERSGISSPSAFSNGGDRDQHERSHERERDRDVKRGRSPESPYTVPHHPEISANLIAGAEDGPRRRKKRNRWGDATENKAAGLMGLPTAIVANMTSEQLEAYTLHLRIEEITQKLKIDDVVPADGDRYVLPLRTSRL
jgi:splicing factor 1